MIRYKHFTPNLIVVLIIVALTIGCKKDEPNPLPTSPDETTLPSPMTGAVHANQNVGASAFELLSNTKYPNLIVEVSYMNGYKPTQRTLDKLKLFLEARLNKTSIDIQAKQIPASGNDSYTLEQLRAEDTTHRSLFTEDKTITTHLMIVDGFYDEGESVLGIAYRNTSMVLFGKAIQKYSGGLGQPSRPLLESSVTLHEFGHILGLVNVGTDMQAEHQDEAHGKHCDNETCLMYWTAENGDAISSLLGSGTVPLLDQNCVNDLQANGGK